MPESVVLLHGFSGTRRAWDGVVALLDPERYRPLALDLPGHGEAVDAGRPIGFADCEQAVLDAAPERFTLVGYSMGGRIAMHVALAARARRAPAADLVQPRHRGPRRAGRTARFRRGAGA